VSEYVFGVADITGAYIAGVILSTNHKSAAYVDKRVNTNTYMIFGPIFFANIGIGMAFDQMSIKMFLFGLVFVLFAILGKIIGCGAIAKATKFSLKDSLKIGVGMIARGEVALVVTQKGVDAGIIEGKYMTVVVMLVLVSSILAPILLKLLFKNDPKDDGNNQNETNNNIVVENNDSGAQPAEIVQNVSSNEAPQAG
jgi:Kef-type K+ transport system membrane component KefB